MNSIKNMKIEELLGFCKGKLKESEELDYKLSKIDKKLKGKERDDQIKENGVFQTNDNY